MKKPVPDYSLSKGRCMAQVDFRLAGQRGAPARRSAWRQAWRQVKRDYFYYLMAALPLAYFLVFHYVPMFGIIIAFKDYDPFLGFEGIFTTPWVGFTHFINFFKSIYFNNVMGNTLVISVLKLAFGFPAPLILALLINEVRNQRFKRVTQTISYLPHFFSIVVVAGLVRMLLTVQGGLVNQLVVALGGEAKAFLTDPSLFRGILVTTSVWQTVGWGSILYLAAMTSISPDLYEAAMIDGANKFQQMLHVTIPGISFVIAIQLVFAIGGLLSAGFEQILLLYSPSVYGVADIIDTYVYRSGLLNRQYSYAAAVGLFKSFSALLLIFIANKAAKRVGQPGIW